jgi:hypothetical protein
MTDNQIKRDYLAARCSYEYALIQLERLGYGAGEADDFLFAKDTILDEHNAAEFEEKRAQRAEALRDMQCALELKADQRVADIKAGKIKEGPALLAQRFPKIF